MAPSGPRTEGGKTNFRRSSDAVLALYSDKPPKEVKGASGRNYGEKSLFCLEPAREPRRSCIFLVESPWFDNVILVTILANCVLMAWESPLDPPGTWKEAMVMTIEGLFLAIFTVELAMKVIAYGFALTGTGAYLRDPWCRLDFIVVTFAWVPILFPSVANVSAIRTLRALRPLRALKVLPGMPIMVQSILSTLPKLGNVVMLLFVIWFIFSIFGFELFRGTEMV